MEREFKKPMRRPARRKVCNFCVDKVEEIDYKDVQKLRKFTSDRAKILAAAMENYNPARQEDKVRVQNALSIMLTAYLAAKMQQKAEQMLQTILL